MRAVQKKYRYRRIGLENLFAETYFLLDGFMETETKQISMISSPGSLYRVIAVGP
jgi:hypothetical protein